MFLAKPLSVRTGWSTERELGTAPSCWCTEPKRLKSLMWQTPASTKTLCSKQRARQPNRLSSESSGGPPSDPLGWGGAPRGNAVRTCCFASAREAHERFSQCRSTPSGWTHTGSAQEQGSMTGPHLWSSQQGCRAGREGVGQCICSLHNGAYTTQGHTQRLRQLPKSHCSRCECAAGKPAQMGTEDQWGQNWSGDGAVAI